MITCENWRTNKTRYTKIPSIGIGIIVTMSDDESTSSRARLYTQNYLSWFECLACSFCLSLSLALCSCYRLLIELLAQLSADTHTRKHGQVGGRQRRGEEILKSVTMSMPSSRDSQNVIKIKWQTLLFICWFGFSVCRVHNPIRSQSPSRSPCPVCVCVCVSYCI